MSPLGLINPQISNYGKNNYESIFSSWEDNNKKQTIKSIKDNNRTGTPAYLDKSPHNNDVYNIKPENIIEKLKDIKHLSLSPGDFAYLRDLGVYPNNRLVAVRRFQNPVVDDLYSLSNEDGPGNPLSTIIGWTESFKDLSISVNEDWTNSEVSFKNILNGVGKDFSIGGSGGKLGDYLERGLDIVPLPGATLLLQRKIMQSLGLIENVDAATIPVGSPNLIKDAKVRRTIDDDSSGSGLKGKFTITLETTYEQKFINGVDPTHVFMDIINNALNMGTSPSVFYLGLDKDKNKRVKKFIDDITKNPMKKIKEFLSNMITSFKDQLNLLKEKISKAGGFVETAKKVANEVYEVGKSIITDQLNNSDSSILLDIFNTSVEYVMDFIKNKYKVKFMGVISALSGAPSTPWHVTVGNPLRPIFCSGDMLCTGVDIKFGDQLSFNDLPSFITLTIKLTSARDLGLQEIFSKFNQGQIRTSNGEYLSGDPKSFWNFKLSGDKKDKNEKNDNDDKIDNPQRQTGIGERVSVNPNQVDMNSNNAYFNQKVGQ